MTKQHLIDRINADPSDMESRIILADLLDEAGDKFVVGWRRLNEAGKVPARRRWYHGMEYMHSLGDAHALRWICLVLHASPFVALQAAAEVLTDEQIPLLGEVTNA